MPAPQDTPVRAPSSHFKSDSEFQLLGADCNSRSLIVSIQNRNSRLDAENISLRTELSRIKSGLTRTRIKSVVNQGYLDFLQREIESFRLQARAEICFLREQVSVLTTRNHTLEVKSLGPTPFIFGDARDSLPGTQGTGWRPSRRFPVKPRNFDSLLVIARERALMRLRALAAREGKIPPTDLPLGWTPDVPPPSKEDPPWSYQGRVLTYEELMSQLRSQAKLEVEATNPDNPDRHNHP